MAVQKVVTFASSRLQRRCFVKRTLLLLAVSAVMVLVAGSAVPARQHSDDGTSASATASATATATASATATATATAGALPQTAGMLKRTGGPPLAVPVVLGALIMVGSGVAAFSLVRRYTSS
jgi:hypothetical protein